MLLVFAKPHHSHYIRSVEYGISSPMRHQKPWFPDSDIEWLPCIQNAAARLSSHCQKFDHISPVLEQLHCLPIRQRIAFKILVLTYKALHNKAPQHYTPTNHWDWVPVSCWILIDTTPKPMELRLSHSFAPIEYHRLPCVIKESPTTTIFKSKLKTHLVMVAYG